MRVCTASNKVFPVGPDEYTTLWYSSTIIKFVIPVVFNKLTRVEVYMYFSNTTLFDGRGIESIYYIRYNNMFPHLTMAIFRLYMKYFVSSYTAHLNTTEKFHIHTEFAKNNHLNDPQTILTNAL